MEPLVIPLTISGEEALRMLERLKSEGGKVGDTLKKGATDAKEGHDELAGALRRVNIESQAIAMGRQMLDLLAQGAVESSRELQKMAQEFINLRDRARELAGVMGKSDNLKFTKEQAHFAAETGFADPNKAVDYRTAFQGEASQYADRFKSEDEYQKFEKEAARLGNKNNVPPQVMAELAGMVVRTGAKEGQTSEEEMRRLGASFKTMMAGSGGIGELAGQLKRMSAMVGEGKAFPTIEEAATGVRVSAESNLEEAYTKQVEMRQGVVELSTDAKKADQAKALGFTPKTSNIEAIKSLSEGQASSGEAMEVYLGKFFSQERIKRAFGESIEAYRGDVVKKGLADAGDVKPGEVEKESAAYFADPLQPGKLAVEMAKRKEKEFALGDDKATIAPYMEQAKGELAGTEASPVAKGWTGFMDMTSGWWRGAHGMGYRGFEQMETAKAMGNIRTEAEAAGIDTSNAPSVASAPQRDVEKYMADLVRLTQEANEMRRKAEIKPLSAPPPSPHTRP